MDHRMRTWIGLLPSLIVYLCGAPACSAGALLPHLPSSSAHPFFIRLIGRVLLECSPRCNPLTVPHIASAMAWTGRLLPATALRMVSGYAPVEALMPFSA